MSNQAQGLVRGLPLRAPDKPILMAYAAYADDLGYTWAGVEVIAFDTGYSTSTVKDARKTLIAAGWMASKRRFGTSSIVRLNLDRMLAAQVDRGEGKRIHPELEFAPESAPVLTLADHTPQTPRSGTKGREPDERKPAGRRQLAATRTFAAHEQPPGGCLDSHQAAVYSSGSRPVSVSDSSDDPSVDARATPGGETDPWHGCDVNRVDYRRGTLDPDPPPGPGRHHIALAAPHGRVGPEGIEESEGNHPPEMRDENRAPTLSALTLVAGLDFGPHRRPTTVQAAQLAILVDAAFARGLTPAEVRHHAQGTVNAAKHPARKGNAVRYLINGLAPEMLPVPHVAVDHHAPHRAVEQGVGTQPDVAPPPATALSPGRREAMAAARALPQRVPIRGPVRRPRIGTRTARAQDWTESAGG